MILYSSLGKDFPLLEMQIFLMINQNSPKSSSALVEYHFYKSHTETVKHLCLIVFANLGRRTEPEEEERGKQQHHCNLATFSAMTLYTFINHSLTSIF